MGSRLCVRLMKRLTSAPPEPPFFSVSGELPHLEELGSYLADEPSGLSRRASVEESPDSIGQGGG